MLALIENFAGALRKARIESDIVDLMGDICLHLGFRSSFLIEYVIGDMSSVVRILDTSSTREGWWLEYLASGMRTKAAVAELIGRGTVSRFAADRFGPLDGAILVFAQRADIVDCTLVHVSMGGDVVGFVGFSGSAFQAARVDMGLQSLAYALFAQSRTIKTAHAEPSTRGLTPREKAVISLSADGLTSHEIASKLGISARTVNQHVDNVAAKLGTKNRPHTIAEAIRHNLLR
jgi:LuxR family quorum sensing-dependent transcriptional regulator